MKYGASVALIALALLSLAVLAGDSLALDVVEFDVAPSLATFNAPAGTPGPFHIRGPIFPAGTLNADGSIPEGAEPIGRFDCWGYFLAKGPALVSQSYELQGRGDIQVQGREREKRRRAIVGGTREFADSDGYMTVVFYANDLSFTATFTLHN